MNHNESHRITPDHTRPAGPGTSFTGTSFELHRNAARLSDSSPAQSRRASSTTVEYAQAREPRAQRGIRGSFTCCFLGFLGSPAGQEISPGLTPRLGDAGRFSIWMASNFPGCRRFFRRGRPAAKQTERSSGGEVIAQRVKKTGAKVPGNEKTPRAHNVAHPWGVCSDGQAVHHAEVAAHRENRFCRAVSEVRCLVRNAFRRPDHETAVWFPVNGATEFQQLIEELANGLVVVLFFCHTQKLIHSDNPCQVFIDRDKDFFLVRPKLTRF